MTLEIGKKAPLFTLKDQTDKKISLKDLLGKKIILYFYPRDMTPGCTTEACDFNENLAIIKKKKAIVLGVSTDSIEKHAKFAEKYGLKFSLLADENHKVCEKYGVWQEKNFYGKKSMGIVRSTFIIDVNGKITNIYSKVKVKGHIEKVLEEI